MSLWKRCLILCSVAVVSQAANLRGNATTLEESEEEPRLVNAELINAFHNTYGWEVVDYLQQQIAANYDPLYVGQETTVDASGFELPAYLPNCLQEAAITVGVGYITGLSNLDVNGFEMIPGTEDIKFFGFSCCGALSKLFKTNWSSSNLSFTLLVLRSVISYLTSNCLGSNHYQVVSRLRHTVKTCYLYWS